MILLGLRDGWGAGGARAEGYLFGDEFEGAIAVESSGSGGGWGVLQSSLRVGG